MKKIGYVLKTKQYYFTCILLAAFFLISSFSFSGAWTKSTETLKTFNQCSAGIIAYDALADTKDSFANFERNAIVSLTGEEGESLNVFVYQFLDNTNYSDKTIVNPQNVLLGDYKVLEANEIAIPNSIAKQYRLTIGDRIFVDQNPCIIKYVFRDVYQVYEVNFSISQTIVIVGSKTVDELAVVNYCNFDPEEGLHQQLRNINPIRKNLLMQTIIYLISIFTLVLVCTFVMSLFRRKEEIKSYRYYRLSGGKGTFFKLFIVEIMFIVPPIFIVGILGIIFSLPMTLLVALSIGGFFGWLLNLFVIYVRALR